MVKILQGLCMSMHTINKANINLLVWKLLWITLKKIITGHSIDSRIIELWLRVHTNFLIDLYGKKTLSFVYTYFNIEFSVDFVQEFLNNCNTVHKKDLNLGNFKVCV